MAKQVAMSDDLRDQLARDLVTKEIEGIKIARVFRPGTTALTFLGFDDFGQECIVKLVPRSSYGEQAPYSEIARLADADRRYLVVPSMLREVVLKLGNAKYKFLFFLSRRVHGVTLEEFLASGTPFPVREEVSRFVKHLHTALNELEKHRLNHGDLHARNIIRETVGEGGPDPEVRYVVIDFSEMHDSTKLKEGCTWDVEMFGKHLGAFYRTISLCDDLSRSDEEVLAAIQRLPGMTERKGTEEPAVTRAEDVAAWYSEGLRQIQQSPAKLDHPFEAWSAEYIPNDALLVSLCHVDSPYLRELLEKPGNVVLSGPRGTGKSMLFRRFRFLTKVAAREEISDVRHELAADDYVGLYIPCEALFHLRFANLGEADVKRNSRALRTFFNLAIFAEVARVIARLPDEIGPVSGRTADEVIEILKAEAGSLWSDLGLGTWGRTWHEMEGAASAMMRAIQRSVARSDRSLAVGAQDDFIFRLVECLQEGIPGLSHRHFIVFLDDYTDERVPVALQEELDHIVTHRSSVVSFKISSHMYGSIYTSTRKSAPDEWRNFTPYDLGWHYLRRSSGEERMLLEILDKRIANCTLVGGRIEEWLGHRSLPGGRDLAFALYDPDTRDTSVYHGVETLTEMCTGDFSEMIRLAHRIFKKAGVARGTAPRVIDPGTQHKAIVEFSREHLVAIQFIVPRGEKLYEIVQAFGQYSRLCLRAKSLIEKRKDSATVSPYRVLTAYVEDLGRSDTSALVLWEALQKASLFVDAQSAPSRTGALVNRATLRRLLCPAFGLPFTQSEHLSLRGPDFEYWMKQPGEWVETKFKVKLKQAGVEPLFAELRDRGHPEGIAEIPIPQLDTSSLVQRDWRREAPQPWAEAVQSMADLEQLASVEASECHYDLLVAAVGFEERTTGALAALAEKRARVGEVIALEIGKYPRETQKRRPAFNDLVGAVTGGKPHIPTSAPVDHPDTYFLARFMATVESLGIQRGKIAFDITSCPSLVLSQALCALFDIGCDLTLLYTEPEKHLPRAGTPGPPDGREKGSRFLPFTGVRFVAAPPCLQADDTRQLPLTVVIFPAPSAERIGKAVKEIGPARQIWLFGEPHYEERNGNLLDLVRQESSTLLRPDDTVGMTSRFHYKETLLALGGIYREYRHDYRIVVIPHGSKMQTTGALLFRAVHDAVSFVFAMPENYDPSRFSEGTAVTWRMHLGDTRALKMRLREARVVEGRPRK